jgi:hypothetical protein
LQLSSQFDIVLVQTTELNTDGVGTECHVIIPAAAQGQIKHPRLKLRPAQLVARPVAQAGWQAQTVAYSPLCALI